jgi:hypothetical protein
MFCAKKVTKLPDLTVPVYKIDSLYPEMDIERSPLSLFVTNSKQEF